MNDQPFLKRMLDIGGDFELTYGDFECVECQEHFSFEEELFDNRCGTCIDQGEN